MVEELWGSLGRLSEDSCLFLDFASAHQGHLTILNYKETTRQNRQLGRDTFELVTKLEPYSSLFQTINQRHLTDQNQEFIRVRV